MSDSTRRELVFEARDHLFSADVRDVRRVAELVESTPVPGATTGVLGLVNLQGTLVVAADLGSLLGLGVCGGEEAALVLLERGARRAALRVDCVVAVEACSDEDECGSEGVAPSELGALEIVSGVWRFDSRPVHRLDSFAILSRVLAGPGEPVPIRS